MVTHLSELQFQQLVGDQSQPDNISVNVQLPRGGSWQNERPILNQQQKSEQRHTTEADMFSSQENSLKADTMKNDITNLIDSIASVEAELIKVSLRKDFLGRDSNGRAYWAFYCPGARPWIMACGDLASKQKGPQDYISIPGSDKWMYYESGDDIEKLFGWLSENNAREKELRESILLFQINKLKDSKYNDNHILNKGGKNDNERKDLSVNILATKAMSALEKKFGPCIKTEAIAGLQSLALGASQSSIMYRCDCLELLWSSKDHCYSCHRSFPTFEELRQHSKENCKPVESSSKKIQTTEEMIPKRKKSRFVALQEKRSAGLSIPQTPTSEKQASFVSDHADCPFNFDEIMTRFIVSSSVKDEVNSIGLIGNGGEPYSLPSCPPHLVDPALSLNIGGRNEASSSNTKDEGCKFSRYVENGSTEDGSAVQRLKMSERERDQVCSRKDKSSVIGLLKSNIIRESSSRPLVGRAAEILRFLKINLLDMDAALPEDALRKSRTSQERRCAWRSFVKSAKSIYDVSPAFLFL